MKHIVLGVTGGIACYKALEIVSKLKKMNYSISVIMTKSATEFIQPLTFQSLTGNKVVVSMFDHLTVVDVEHIALAKKADLFLVAPATANIVGKVYNGIADDMLSTTIMATKAPVVFALAMNTNMYENKIVQRNINGLKELGYYFIDPASGMLACGDVGKGKLADVEDIVDYVTYILTKKDLLGKKIMITSGGTIAPIDPVRLITNKSSGKMGYHLCKEARNRGAEVIFINASTMIVNGVQNIAVQTNEEMYQAVRSHYDSVDVVIKAAAVSDFKVLETSEQKIKKKETLSLTLVKDHDILKILGENKKHQLLVGFSAETENVIENATKKKKNKNLDYIIANDVSHTDSGFHSDFNRISIIHPSNQVAHYEKMSKEDIATIILDTIQQHFKA